MKRLITIFIILLISCNTTKETIDQNVFNQSVDNWAIMYRETQIDQLLLELSKNLIAQPVLFEHANVITMTENKFLLDQSVFIENGIIKKIGKIDRTTLAGSVKVVNANGKYLIPGLTDAHAHVAEGSHSEKLLFLLAGVTTVREMCGFDWMLPLRESISKNQILAPNLYLASTMMNYTSLGVYTTVVKSEEEAREMVRKQVAKGYDYIKVWNVMPVNILKAIADECHKLNIDLIGHVSHEATIQDALDIGMKTQEHLKGFILDRSLTLSNENYVSVINQHPFTDFWLTPTFALYLQGLKGDTARNFYKQHGSGELVPKETLKKWLMDADEPSTGSFGNKPFYIKNLMESVYRKLEKTSVRYIAGTDFNGENNNMIAGYSLLEELKEFESLGMSPYEVIKTATINAANALGKADEFGTIEIGKRADLILLEKNPLEDLSVFYDDKAVMIRGIWLDNSKMKSIKDKIRSIYQSEITNLLRNPNELVQLVVNHYKNDDIFNLIKPISVQQVSWRLSKIGLKTEAIDLMNRLIKKYPSYDSYDLLAQIQLTAGDTINAKKSMEQSVQLYPRGDYSSAKLKELKIQ